jgi:hypothetical protein
MNSSNWVDSRYGFGTALNFNGSNDYINITRSGDSTKNYLWDTMPQQLTVQAWIKVNHTNHDSKIFYHGEKGMFEIGVDENSNAYFRIWIKTAPTGWNFFPYLVLQPITSGTWYHIAGTWVNNSAIKFYINGELKNTTSISNTYGLFDIGAFNGGQSFDARIGTYGGGNERYFDGIIDEVKVSTVIENIGCDVLTLPFEGTNESEILSDRSSLGNNLSKGAIHNQSTGKYGNSVDFSSNDWILISDPSSSLRPTKTITIEFWILPHNTSSYQTIIYEGFELPHFSSGFSINFIKIP